MNFKEAILTGFKSFADKTSIKFSDGVTCIVGPNGCGKSNVADAVRWVLGEQSAKTLRGTNMQDVIFGGTETRRQLSYCEVTLVFDNTQRLFDIEYDEVAMTRRLYRSGESEYLLNMQPCRLKDIIALLHGVGVAKEGYSIIGQGRVEQIMNAKPEDRRAIFEEATGVMKFKNQKGEIERKLESARDNLTVFVQRMDEAEKQLKPLEKQAETAKKYREFSDSLKYEEVNSYLLRYDNFAYETEKQQARIRRAEESLREVESRLTEVDAGDAESREKIADADDRLRSLNEKLRLFEVDLEHKTGETRLLGERIKSYRRQLDDASDDIEYSRRTIAKIDSDVAESAKLRAKNDKRAKEIEAERAKLLKEAGEAETRVMAYERLADEKRASEISSVENLADVRANVGSLSAKRDAAQDRIGEVREALAKVTARERDFSAQLEVCLKEKKGCEEFLDGKEEERLSAQVADLASSERRISEEIVNCNTSIANLENNLEIYRSLKNKFNGYRDSVRRIQLAAKEDREIAKRLKGAIADIVSTEKEYEVAIETAFGAAMQNLVTATQDDARYLIEYLKRTGGGIATFLPAEAMRSREDSREVRRALSERGAVGLADELVKYDPYYDDVIKNLLANTLVCDTIGSATAISKRYPHAFKIVTLDGDTIATGGAMTGGSHRRETSGNLLASERNIKECEENIQKKHALLEKLQKALVDCQRELDEARAAFETHRTRIQEETAHFAAVSQREIALKSLIEDAARDEREYSELLDRLTRTVDSLQSEVNLSAENEEVLARIREEAAQETSLRAQESEKLKAERNAIIDKLHALDVESAALESMGSSEEERVKHLLAEKTVLLKKVEDTRGSIAEKQAAIEKLKREEEAKALTEEERRTVDALREQLGAVEAEKKKAYDVQLALAEEKRGLLTRQMTLSEEKHASELEISRAEERLESMKQRIDEAYGLTYESAQELRDPAYDITQANTNINSLRHRIAALGPVNFNAEEDYTNLLDRYTEMQTQREDLDKGIVDLTGVLNKLRDEMQRQFDEGFNEINKNFTQIFKELFGGGKAYMELDYTDCTDPLEAGIEIVACPPGKRLTKISLLSGGERAFTAIAILFAILKTRPMPFCILDEIEAALDEANVDRFAKYLKKFSKDTQFIVITHRKPTMTQADTLFGVTMEEKGVSKIVSVKLSEIESRLGGDTVQ